MKEVSRVNLSIIFFSCSFLGDDENDNDGVPDYIDECSLTPAGVAVDKFGCPVDTDKDGVPDYMDNCPDSPQGVSVDALDCVKDSDKDNIPDYLDKCPDTPA